MSALRLSYTNIFVTDLARAIRFYQDILGLPLKFQHEELGYASFTPGGTGLGIARVDPKDSASQLLVGRHTGIGWGVADLDAAYAELSTKGVRFTTTPTKQPWGGYMATFADPDGNIFYLDQLREE